VDDVGEDDGGGSDGGGGGCGCTVPGSDSSPSWLLLFGLVALVIRRKPR
jgi:MYXO-CTERM domain-containing protein